MGADDFTKGDFVRSRGSWYEVLRVNKKTLTVAWNLRLAPKTVMTAADATFEDGRVGRQPVDYSDVKTRMSAGDMARYLERDRTPSIADAKALMDGVTATSTGDQDQAPAEVEGSADIPERLRDLLAEGEQLLKLPEREWSFTSACGRVYRVRVVTGREVTDLRFEVRTVSASGTAVGVGKDWTGALEVIREHAAAAGEHEGKQCPRCGRTWGKGFGSPEAPATCTPGHWSYCDRAAVPVEQDAPKDAPAKPKAKKRTSGPKMVIVTAAYGSRQARMVYANGRGTVREDIPAVFIDAPEGVKFNEGPASAAVWQGWTRSWRRPGSCDSAAGPESASGSPRQDHRTGGHGAGRSRIRAAEPGELNTPPRSPAPPPRSREAGRRRRGGSGHAWRRGGVGGPVRARRPRPPSSAGAVGTGPWTRLTARRPVGPLRGRRPRGGRGPRGGPGPPSSGRTGAPGGAAVPVRVRWRGPPRPSAPTGAAAGQHLVTAVSAAVRFAPRSAAVSARAEVRCSAPHRGGPLRWTGLQVHASRGCRRSATTGGTPRSAGRGPLCGPTGPPPAGALTPKGRGRGASWGPVGGWGVEAAGVSLGRSVTRRATRNPAGPPGRAASRSREREPGGPAGTRVRASLPDRPREPPPTGGAVADAARRGRRRWGGNRP
ncbi:hypothetical protein SHKM778_94500 (plasmid) [Streptomyces sp. KM77-8]|uniref:Uncharacterized protein n=1 Tax=Streptomyces haneummycinicus TaxID=3074435 RepID=A0AAT9HZM7_9ACTN